MISILVDGGECYDMDQRNGAILRNVAIDDLGETDVTTVGCKVECLGLDTGAIHDVPFQVILLQFGIGLLLGLLGDRSYRAGSVLWFGGSGHIGEPATTKTSSALVNRASRESIGW